jgi:two-component system chemotaxis response regulator CheB
MFAQDEATSVVWGMPGAVTTAGQADRVLPLEQMASQISSAVSKNQDRSVGRHTSPPMPSGVGA